MLPRTTTVSQAEVWRGVRWSLAANILLLLFLVVRRDHPCGHSPLTAAALPPPRHRHHYFPPPYSHSHPGLPAVYPPHQSRHNFRRARITHVVISFAASEYEQVVRNLGRWDRFPPCEASLPGATPLPAGPLGAKVGLVMAVEGPRNATIGAALNRAFADLPAAATGCFSSVGIIFNASPPPLGDGGGGGDRVKDWKTWVMLRMLKGMLGLRDPSHVLFMGPEARAQQRHWLSRLDAATRWPNPYFWVKGMPTDRGGEAEPARVQPGLHPTAIYNLSDQTLRFFCEQVEKHFGSAGDAEQLGLPGNIYRYLFDQRVRPRAIGLAHLFQTTRLISLAPDLDAVLSHAD